MEAEIGPAHKPLALEAVATRTGIEDPEVTWKLEGRSRVATFTHSDPPPSVVTWQEVAPTVEGLQPDELLIGLGKKRELVTVSLKDDSPQFLISMGTGAGKSTTAAFWIVQALMRGDIVLILDPKQHQPPVGIQGHGRRVRRSSPTSPTCAASPTCTTPWRGSVTNWTAVTGSRGGHELQRARSSRVTSAPGSSIICEEVNLGRRPPEAALGRDPHQGDPKKSPAFTGLGAVAFAGRAVKMHLVVIGQMVTAAVLGGGAVRENMGVRCLARYTQNSWKMQAGDIPMPPSPSVTGRVQCIASGESPRSPGPLRRHQRGHLTAP